MSALLRVTSFNEMGKGFTIRGVPVDETGYKTDTYMIRLDLSKGMLPVEPALGQIWSVGGEFLTETRPTQDGFTEQTWRVFKAPESLDLKMPNDGESFVQFLARDPQFVQIGEQVARKIWSTFGTKIYDHLNSGLGSDIKALRDVLSNNQIKNLFAGFARYENLAHSTWMTKAGIDFATQRRILKHHKFGTIEDLKANPYELIHYGFSMNKIDAMLESGAWPEAEYPEQRVGAAAHLALRACLKDGSTFTTRTEVAGKAGRWSGSQTRKAFREAVLQYLDANENIAITHEQDGSVHPTATAIQELAIAKRLVALSKVTQPFDDEAEQALTDFLDDLPYALTDKQQEAIRVCVTNQVSCITGGAGTGKTTVLNGVLSVLDSLGYDIHAVALSGRAAMRLHESIVRPTMTIARLLREDPLAAEEGDKKLLVIDEASMVDQPTMFRLVNHMSPHVKLIFAGDPNQLPPIGIGKILKDVVDSGLIKNTMLDVVKRQEGSSGIPEYSNQVNAGEVPSPLAQGKIDFIDSSADKLIENAVKLYKSDPENSRVVAYTNKVTKATNLAIQDAVNPDGERLKLKMYGDTFLHEYLRRGDQVLFTRNHYQEGVQNGSLGKLISVEQTTESFGAVRLDNGEVVELSEGLLQSLALGYAITLHKAQGSQFPKPIVLIEPSSMVDRSWVYTAITRAEEAVYLVGSEDDFSRAVRSKPTAFRRKTVLKELMHKLS